MPEPMRVRASRAKTAVPQVSAGHLARPRLTGVLDAAATGAIVLVSAPAGYGKTLLLAEWVAHRPERTAWVTLDADDNDDHHFWVAVLTAMTTCRAVPTDSPLHVLAPPAVPSRDPAFLAAFVDATQALPVAVTLVLDDVHELVHPDPLHGLAGLVRDRPDRLQIVLATRLDPPVRLDRIRLAGLLLEVRAADLAFAAAEAGGVFAATEIALDTAQLDLLLDRTGGWAAGLRLAALAIADTADREAFLVDLVGNGRAISDYLVGEILSGLPADVLDVLSTVSLCEDLSAPLAVAVAGREDAGDVLAGLERTASLVTSYGEGRRWFRVHPLLRAQLRADLLRRRPDLAAAAHDRAARWLSAADDPRAALRHARLSGDTDLLARILAMHGAELATTGRHEAVRLAVATLAPEQLRHDPQLALVGALAWLEVGQLGEADRLLADALAAWPATPGAELQATRGLVTARRAWLGTTWVDAEPSAGEHGAAAVIAQRALDHAVRDRHAYLAARATTAAAVVQGLIGDVGRMVALAEQSVRIAPVEGWRNTVSHAWTEFLIGFGALLQARPRDCLRSLSAVDEIGEAMRSAAGEDISGIIPVLASVRAAARFDLGNRRAVLDELRTARENAARGRALDQQAHTVMALLEHDVASRLGRRTQARAVLGWAEETLGATGDVRYLRARGLVDISRHEAAREHLRPLLDGSVPPAVRWTLVEGWLLECAVAVRTGGGTRARWALLHALATARDTGVLRPLVAAPPEVATLMAEQVGSLGEDQPLARDVLARRRERVADCPSEPLTEREHAVLDMLPTLLSLEEIADELAVTVNTVKTHVRAVYAKLGVGTRRDAVDAARRSGLLAPGDSRARGG